ncbi:hypothetical protein [Bacillus thuringiensis]|uniref:Uncharacterized protein n=1 Tax=Bacillus thuringiensis subsp. darmstadiensis TaxID=132264 RepID=A0A9X6FTX0_BACUD|nr:hypothetical protein [Bacillus thuringiensis]ADH09679.1 hypothetical protein BMB171_C4871 [Bacillus thuringiensis BMB171]MDA2637648.1 hypothetical protein [Bacillus cereus]OTZ28876.1 hypothetical protein BK761_28470 [Bacillus thuringiensis serovar darmstadiensis]HDR6291345.1 hypothetical protein [Bacillus cereus]
MNKFKKIDRLIIVLLIITIFFARYFKVLYPEWYRIDFLIMVYLCMRLLKLKFKLKLSVAVSFYFLILIICINVMKFGIGTVAIDNLLMTFMPLTIIFYAIYLKTVYRYEVLHVEAYRFTKFLNIYFLFNSSIIVVQFLTGSFMMEQFFKINPLIEDHMTGFIGMSGGNILNFLWIATLLFNLYFYFEKKSVKRLIIILVEMVTMMGLSVVNENKMFFVTVIIYLLLFFFIQLVRVGIEAKHFRRFSQVVCFSVIGFFVLYVLNENIANEMDNVFNLLKDFMSNDIPDHHNERAYLNYLAFEVYNAATYGIGVNSIDLNNQSIHQHLGISSSSFIMMQGGLVYFIAIVNFYTLIILDLISINKRVTKFVMYIIVFVTMLIVAYATQPFRDHYVFAMLVSIYFACYLSFARTKEVKN